MNTCLQCGSPAPPDDDFCDVECADQFDLEMREAKKEVFGDE